MLKNNSPQSIYDAEKYRKYTITSLKNEARRIIASGKRTVEPGDPDYDLLTYMFGTYHPHWFQKSMGANPARYIIGWSEWGNKALFVERRDGTTTDISYTKLKRNPKPEDDIKPALREAVMPVIEQFRNSIVWPVQCPITEQLLYNDKNTHIDHYDLTFNEVAEGWLKTCQWTTAELVQKINPTADNDQRTYFTDPEVIADFTAYHNSHTHLRAVSKKANLSTLKRKH